LTWGARVCHRLGMPTTTTTNRAALTRLRVEAGLSQSALAERSGIGRTAITRIESGARQGPPETIRAIADAGMTTALAGYLAIGQIAQHLDLTLPDDIAAGEPVTLGIRSVRPDGRSHHDPSFRWPWPGNWTPRIDADASAAECSHGLHIALGWRGLSATGPVHVCQIVGYRESDVAHVAPPSYGCPRLRSSTCGTSIGWPATAT
jgi:transcriptional regulator with XRE-family HTH domain